jgi:hypothetical protein
MLDVGCGAHKARLPRACDPTKPRQSADADEQKESKPARATVFDEAVAAALGFWGSRQRTALGMERS